MDSNNNNDHVEKQCPTTTTTTTTKTTTTRSVPNAGVEAVAKGIDVRNNNNNNDGGDRWKGETIANGAALTLMKPQLKTWKRMAPRDEGGETETTTPMRTRARDRDEKDGDGGERISITKENRNESIAFLGAIDNNKNP